MYGAIIGDVVGSCYKVMEEDSLKEKKIRTYIEKTMIMSNNFPLFSINSIYTGDSILMCSIIDAIMNEESYVDKIKEYGQREISLGHRTKLDKDFIKWLDDNRNSHSDTNDVAMKVIPIGFLYNSLDQVKNETFKVTTINHNHPEATLASETIATSIFLLREGLTKEQLTKYLEDNCYNLNYDLDLLRLNNIFSNKASDTIPQALFCFLKSTSFEDAIRKAISIGGDSSTIAAITGALAEAHYGVPSELVNEVDNYLPDYLKEVVKQGYEKPYMKKIQC